MRRDDERLMDMVLYARKALRDTAGMTRGAFGDDERTQNAVVRYLEVVGEAGARVSTEMRERASDVPWAAIVGMRNRLVHDYADVDLDEVWKTVTDDLPELLRLLARHVPDGEAQTV